MASEHKPLFVRLPTAEADKLDRVAFERKTPKQKLVADLVAHYLEPPQPGRREVRVTLDEGSLAVGRASVTPAEPPEVLTVAQLAELLQVDERTVRRLAARGELPGRKVGRDWRFSRRSVLDWLDGRETPERPSQH